MAKRSSGRQSAKRGMERERNVDPTLAAKLRFKSLLARMKLLAAYEAMPSCIRAQMFDNRAPEPELVFDPSFPSVDAQGKSTQPLRRQIEEGFKTASVDVGPFRMNLTDFFSLAVGLRPAARGAAKPARDVSVGAVRSVDPPLPDSVTTFGESALMILNELLVDRFQHALFDDLYHKALGPLLEHARLDGTLLYGKVSERKMPRGTKVILTIYGQKAQTHYLALDGVRRPVHPAVDLNTWFGPQPVTWTAKLLGEEWARQLSLDADAAVPVYVQSHALDQLKARLDLPKYRPYAQAWLAKALQQPIIAERQSSGEFLVAFKIHEHRVGYLVVAPVESKKNDAPEAFVVRTFLFLTMQRTPEGKKLERRLGLTRDEIDYLGLHEISRYLRTDLKDDEALRALLTSCGCGHLFDLAEQEEHDLWIAPTMDATSATKGATAAEGFVAPAAPKPFASELRKYVGMDRAEAA